MGCSMREEEWSSDVIPGQTLALSDGATQDMHVRPALCRLVGVSRAPGAGVNASVPVVYWSARSEMSQILRLSKYTRTGVLFALRAPSSILPLSNLNCVVS
jgi:hypothetical protein